ncbi:MAG: TonB-dependent receptor, partial [Lysobacteraceae bacterium]
MVHAVQHRALVAAMLAALFASPHARAQPEDEEAPLPPTPVEAPPTRLGPVEVTARGTAADWPSALATDTLDYRDAVAAPVDVQDWVLRTPGVAATGQNGLFETFSIRGNGGNAILTLVGGMPITAQRRAGVPLSFVDPLLLGDVSVTRGPAVTHFGPGALGGAVSVEPRWFDVPTLAARLASGGDEQLLMAATGSDTFSLAVARHEAGNTEAPDGTRLNTAYQRDSAVLQVRTRVGDLDVDALLMPSRSTDIGKSNSRFPARSTTYPSDRHSIGRLRLRHANGLELGLRGHAQRLDTLNQRPGSPDTFASIESTDLGLTLQRRFQAGALDYNLGLEYLGRRDVDGFDARGTLANRTYSLKDAREANLSAFAIADWALSTTLDLELGARGTRVTQRQRGAEADDADAAFTAGAVWRPTAGTRWTLNLSSGYRFPTLEERYFSGVTAQGDIAGNPDLGSEHSLGIDLGFGWNTGPWSGSTHVWRMGVDDLIQLARLQGDLN